MYFPSDDLPTFAIDTSKPGNIVNGCRCAQVSNASLTLPNGNHTLSVENSILAAAGVDGRLWSNESVINISFLDGNAVQHNKFEQCLKLWLQCTNLRVQWLSYSGHVRVTFGGTSCWSYVGTNCLNVFSTQPTMQLANIDGNNPNLTIVESRTILHECGHMLGFIHEHQSPSRVHEVTYKTKATIRYYADTWSPSVVWENVLRVYAEQHLAAYSSFDDMSIMIYEIPPCINRQNRTILRPSHLSEIDKAYAALLYPCITPSHEAALRDALCIANVPPDRQQIILTANEATEFRARFQEWNREVRVTLTRSHRVNPFSLLKHSTNYLLTHITKLLHIHFTAQA